MDPLMIRILISQKTLRLFINVTKRRFLFIIPVELAGKENGRDVCLNVVITEF
jgi:hypothetical protein